ncbi:MAG: CPBP family intramembrane metalloprotease [Bacilli bacterium]|nr:CPBP family intramembrane metalloprotease [Bacilli bacterium]MBO4682887.1 CPBP family intramembrane metalloprotease [Bacilli bacterium]
MNASHYIDTKKKTIIAILIIYFLCFAFRALEYFVIRTDQTFLGEAFIHKLIGIGILIVAVKFFQFTFADIGFKTGKALLDILKGLGFGLATFTIAYGVELIIVGVSGELKGLELYVTAYSVNGNIGHQTDFYFFIICIVGNIINVLMEEGVFRGLFQKMLGNHYKFVIAAVIASLLFGFWHIMGPLRNYVDGNQSLGGFIGESCLLIGTSALVGFKFAMMGKLTGNLYMAMGDHFVNNTIINILHVVSTDEADQLQVIRITIAQLLSFTVVLIWYLIIYFKNRKQTQEEQVGE